MSLWPDWCLPHSHPPFHEPLFPPLVWWIVANWNVSETSPFKKRKKKEETKSLGWFFYFVCHVCSCVNLHGRCRSVSPLRVPHIFIFFTISERKRNNSFIKKDVLWFRWFFIGKNYFRSFPFWSFPSVELIEERCNCVFSSLPSTFDSPPPLQLNHTKHVISMSF